MGIEARFTENSNDYLVYGVDGKETSKLFPNLKNGLSDFRKEYHNDNMVFIQAASMPSRMLENGTVLT